MQTRSSPRLPISTIRLTAVPSARAALAWNTSQKERAAVMMPKVMLRIREFLNHPLRSLKARQVSPPEPRPWLLFTGAVILVGACLAGFYGILTHSGQRNATAQAERLTQGVVISLADQL